MGKIWEPTSVKDLLEKKLVIPDYQRPYKWTTKNIEDLLSDITVAIQENEKYGQGFKYRIGTIILYETNGTYEIVDGQQRILSLVLLNHFLRPEEFECELLKVNFTSKITQANMHTNYNFIREWFSLKESSNRDDFVRAMTNILEVIVICVEQLAEAFQLFDSQNTRGKALDPHDLLKAYHLREMKNYPYEMEHAVTKWEAADTDEIRILFDFYLFRIWNWSRGTKTRAFSTKEIDTYKGISEASTYSYAKRASRGMPYFQITEPFIAGNDFFEMVSHYIELLHDVRKEISSNDDFSGINKILNWNDDGIRYSAELFYCVLLAYYDKFHNFDVMAVKKLFTWAFMIRVDMISLGFDTINNYAIGNQNDAYTNYLPMFLKISLARLHSEISNLQIKIIRQDDRAKTSKWDDLYKELKIMNGLEVRENEQ